MTEERILIAALQRGEESAFRTLVSRYQDRVLNTCLGFIPNLHDAQDLTQEVFIEVFQSVGHFRQEATLSTWIYRISVHKSLALIRSRKRKKRALFFQSLIGIQESPALHSMDVFNHPGVILEQAEQSKLMFETIARLPEQQQMAFLLHKIENLSHREIADIMNASIPAVETWIHRAKKNLQKMLSAYYEQNFKIS